MLKRENLTILFYYSHWQSRENPSGDQDPDHWDHALLLTGLDLFAVGRDGITTHQIVGKTTPKPARLVVFQTIDS